MENSFLIDVKNLTLFYGSHKVLDNVSLRVEKKDFITIVGPNGGGKSTLLHCLTGQIKVKKGLVTKKPNLKIGYVPQFLHVDKSIPMSTNYFIRLCKKIDDSEMEKVVRETKIENILTKPFFALSGGEKQKVLLARVLVENPHLLILDEPAQNLDISSQLAFYKLLGEIYKNRDISIIMVSHDLPLVMASTKKVVCLNKNICCVGSPKSVTNNPAFGDVFGKDFLTLMKAYRHDHSGHDHSDNNHSDNDHSKSSEKSSNDTT